MIVDGELRALEERLTSPAAAETSESLAPLFAAEFLEFDSAGRVLDAAGALEAVFASPRPRVVFGDFTTKSIAPGVVLVTYLAKCLPGAGWKPPALRSSLWCWRDGRWQVVFHQATVVPGANG